MGKTVKKVRENTTQLNQIFFMMKPRFFVTERKDSRFNNTELRLLAEVISAKYDNRRLISTQIAELIGVTRSAVSQIVNNLESRGIVKRVADDVDRKIAYIEMTEEALSLYEKDLENMQQVADKIITSYGKEKFAQLYDLYEEFMNCVENESEVFRGEDKKKTKKVKKALK